MRIPSTLMDTFIRFAMVEKVRIAKKMECPIEKQLWNLEIDRQYPGNRPNRPRWTFP